MRTSIYVYVYRFTCAFIYMYIVLNSRPFPYFYFFFFSFSNFFLFSFSFLVHVYAVLEYMLHFLGIMKFHEIHCEKYSERRDEWEMLIVDHLPRALDALSAFTIHDSRLYLYHSTYHPAQIRNSLPSGNNTRRAATWECILSFILFYSFLFFPFLLFLPSLHLFFLFFSFFFPLFPLRRNSNNLRSRRRAPSLTKSSEQPSLSRKIECRKNLDLDRVP